MANGGLLGIRGDKNGDDSGETDPWAKLGLTEGEAGKALVPAPPPEEPVDVYLNYATAEEPEGARSLIVTVAYWRLIGHEGEMQRRRVTESIHLDVAQSREIQRLLPDPTETLADKRTAKGFKD